MSGVQDSARWIVRELAEAKRLARDLGTPQLGTSSIESGKIEEYDSEGVLVQVLGEQHDGTHTTVTVNGPVPPEPMPPTVTAGFGSVEVRASGKFVAGEVSPMDLSHFSVHASRAEMFTPTNETQRSTIQGESGDLSVILLEPGQWSFSLVAVSKAGKWSRMSDVVTVEVPDFPSPVDIQDELLQLDEKYDGVITEAGLLGDRLDQAETDLTAHGERLVENDATIDNLTGTVLPQLQTDISNAEAQLAPLPGLISDNTTKVNDAKTRLDTLNNTTLPGLTTSINDAKTRLTAAEGTLAPLPGKISAAEQGISDAFGQIEAADTKATNASSAAATAKSTADSALTMAGSKSVVYYSTSTPSGTGVKTGDVWRRIDASKNIIGEWYWTGSIWQSSKITSESIANLDVGKLTSSTAVIDSAVINKLAVNIATVIELNASRITAGKITAAQIDVTNLAASIANVIKLNASAINAGTIDAARLDVNALSASIATIISLNASRITAGTINTARLNVSEIAASVATVISLNASRITSGTISTARLNAVEIAAATAAFQTVDVKNLFATTGTMAEAVINKLWAEVVMSKKITAQMLAVGDFTNLAPSLRDQGDSWELSDGVNTSSSSLTPDGIRLKFSNPSGSAYAYGPYHVCEPGEMFHGEADIYRTATATSVVYIRMYWYKKDKTPSSTAYTQLDGGSSGSYPSGAHLQGSAAAPDDAVYVRVGIAVAGQAGDVGVYNIIGRRMSGGELIVDGSVKAKQIDVEDLAANNAFITDLTARIVKSDMFVGKTFTGGTFTGNTFQSHAAADVGVKMGEFGFRAWGPEGGEPIVEITAAGGSVYSVTDPTTGEVLAAMDSVGGLTGQSLTVSSESRMDGPVVMGADPLSTAHGSGDLGPTILGRDLLDSSLIDFMETQETITDDTPWLSALPRGMVTRGYRNLASWQATGKEGELLEISYQNYANRAYKIHISPFSAYLQAGVTAHLRIYRSVGSRPTMNSTLFHRQTLRNETSNSLMLDFGGTFYDVSTSGRVRYLFSLEAVGGKVQVVGSADGGAFRAWVEDIGLSATDTSIDRSGVRDNGSTSAPAAPTAPVDKTDPPVQKVATISATWWQAYTGNNSKATHSTYSGSAAQGRSPYVTSNGVMRGLVGFPSQQSRLSGATVKKIEVYVYSKHWHSSAGGTLGIGTHNHSSAPTSWSSTTNNVKNQKMKKPEGRWITLPSSVHAGFKAGTLKGISFYPPSGSTSSEYYGLVTGNKTKLRITYTV